MLTMEQFNQIPDDEVFAKGEFVDGENGILLWQKGQTLRFVAVKSYANDWAYYVGKAAHSYDYILRYGAKFSRKTGQILINCDDEVAARFRP